VDKIKLRRGDVVQVLAGKDVGKQGAITRVILERNMVIVDGVNVSKKHQKPTRSTQQGGIIDKDMPIHVSKVAFVCSSCGPTRIGLRVEASGAKVRVCRKCGKVV
jgi:large subunit ribosomal protein L24